MAVISAMQVEKPQRRICTLSLGKHNAFARSGREVLCVWVGGVGKDTAAWWLLEGSGFCSRENLLLYLWNRANRQRAPARAGAGSG